MSQWFKLWPLLGLPLMWLLQIDTYVIPLLISRCSFFATVVISCILATIELVYLYWILGWIGQGLKQKTLIAVESEIKKDLGEMNPDIALAKEVTIDVKEELTQSGNLGRIKAIIKKYLDPEKHKDSSVFKLLNWGGYTAVFLLGIIPEPGFRLLGTFFCRIANRHRAFIILLAGNMVKTIMMVKFWESLREIPIMLRIAIVFVFFLFFWLLGKVAHNHIKKLI